MNIKYAKVGDYFLPKIALNNQNYGQINKYGYLRLDYIKEHKRGFYQALLMKNQLANHLLSVSNNASNMLKTLMNNYKLAEKSKKINGLEWVKLMNNYKNCAEEIILNELVYK